MVPFVALRAFNRPELRALASCRGRVDGRADLHFASPSLTDRLVRALAARRALSIKEMVESFEFFGRVRRRLRGPMVVDLGAGHGLTGMLFAVFEPVVEQVVLVDVRRPANHERVRAAVAEVAPWSDGRVRYVEAHLAAPGLVPPGAAIVAVHCCGKRSDRVVDVAIAGGCRLALAPCCYSGTTPAGLEAVERELGAAVVADVDRTYRLRAAGYRVDWAYLPEAVTPMNRILIAHPAGS
jgi:hypothetical protein